MRGCAGNLKICWSSGNVAVFTKFLGHLQHFCSAIYLAYLHVPQTQISWSIQSGWLTVTERACRLTLREWSVNEQSAAAAVSARLLQPYMYVTVLCNRLVTTIAIRHRSADQRYYQADSDTKRMSRLRNNYSYFLFLFTSSPIAALSVVSKDY